VHTPHACRHTNTHVGTCVYTHTWTRKHIWTHAHAYLHLTEFHIFCLNLQMGPPTSNCWQCTCTGYHIVIITKVNQDKIICISKQCNSDINDYVITLWYSFHLEFSSSKLRRFCPNKLISGCNNDCPYACNMATNCSRFSIPSIPGSDKARNTDVW